MARIEWVKLRLNNWALWRAREQAGGLGFAAQSAFLQEVVDRYRESVLPVDETDASVTNDAVESLKTTRPALYDCVRTFYVDGPGGPKATAHRLGIAVSTVHAQLDQADVALSAWFLERAEQQRGRKAAYAACK